VVHYLPLLGGCNDDVGREAWIHLGLAYFLTHAHQESAPKILETMTRLLQCAATAAAGLAQWHGALVRIKLALAQVDLERCDAASIARVRSAVASCKVLAQERPGRECEILLGLASRMEARCDAVSGDHLQCLVHCGAAAASIGSMWRELAQYSFLPIEASELCLQWTIWTSPRRSEQQMLGTFQLAT
jgi:hypothetical protein